MTAILLTSPVPALVQGVAQALPSTRVAPLDPERVDRLEGREWCFVDWLLDDISGLEVCRRLRAGPGATCRVTMVLETDDPAARRRALAAGADDYMLAPLTAERIVARVGPNLAAAGAPARSRLANCGLTLDPAAHQVRWQGKLVALRPRELRLLALFLAHPDELFSRERIVSEIGQDSEIGDERTVDVWVGRLRRTLRAHGVPDVLRTVRSFGYVFDTPDLQAAA